MAEVNAQKYFDLFPPEQTTSATKVKESDQVPLNNFLEAVAA
jgi:hypothetical protein